MAGHLPIFYSALMLTGTNLILRFVGTSFQVYLSSRIGAAGIGLLQLVMSVGGLAAVAAIAGVRTATIYLTAEELGRKKPGNVCWVLSGCFLYSTLFSGAVAAALYFAAPYIGTHWIGDHRTVSSIRLLAAFLPATSLCAVMTGYFTAANRIGTLAAIEVCEQLISMCITVGLLTFWAQNDAVTSCHCIILGSSMGGCVTLLLLILFRLREKVGQASRIPVCRRLCHAALPLALGDVLRSGISTLENLTVPRQLAKNPSIASPLAAFGTVSGMVFPVLMFPACILFGLNELLIPELARCNASGNHRRTSYLVRKSLRLALLYGALFCGILFLIAQPLCEKLYRNTQAGIQLKRYVLLIPMLYCDTVTDAMTKGLGQQKACVRYNILTSTADLVLLYYLLPKYGMDGYFLSFFITHLVNFLLSLRRLKIITGESLSFSDTMYTAAAAVVSIRIAAFAGQSVACVFSYCVLLVCFLYLTRVLSREDFLWIWGLRKTEKQSA